MLARSIAALYRKYRAALWSVLRQCRPSSVESAPMPNKSFPPVLILVFCAVASLSAVAAERRTPAQSNSASTTLIETASRQYENGQLDQAAATLERALHIQPNNPATLHYLGVLRLQQLSLIHI